MVLRGYIAARGYFFISFACQECPQWDVRPLPHRKPPAHLDSTRTPLTAWLVKRLGKHTDKQSQPHLNQLISKSILLATRKTCAADDSLDTCRHPDTAVNVSQSFPSSETHISVLYYPAQSRVQASFPFFSHIQLIPNVWQTHVES